MKKLAFIVQHLTNGGAERTVSNLSLALQKECDVTLIVFDGNNCTYPYGGKLIDLGIPPAKSIVGKLFNIIRRIVKTRKIRKQYNFDCVISFMFGANIVNVLSKCGEKTIISERNYIGAYGRGLFNYFRVKAIASRCDLDIALSKMVEYDLVHNFKLPSDKVKTIYNPIDVSRIREKAQQSPNFDFDANCFYISSAGRFVKQKGQWHLLKAFSLFHKKYINSKLILLGDGPLRSNLEILSEQLGISDSVIFLGFQDNPYSFISRSSCFVLSSLFEGLGNVILEAMACQVPVISFDCLAGPRELIAPNTPISSKEQKYSWQECGLLVVPPDMNITFDTETEECDLYLSKAMESLYLDEDNKNRIIQTANVRIEEFLPSRITSQWKSLF